MPVSAVILVEDGFLVQDALDDSTARQDDAFWARQSRLPATPQRLLNWWVARRWVVPRDVRRR
jgi:hypothetical protein